MIVRAAVLCVEAAATKVLVADDRCVMTGRRRTSTERIGHQHMSRTFFEARGLLTRVVRASLDDRGGEVQLYHYTDRGGFNSIRSHSTWMFRASQPPGEHPVGAYFTNLDQGTPHLAQKLRIPRDKLEYVLGFTDMGDLRPLRGGRGRFIFYSPVVYHVALDRQTNAGPTDIA